MSKPNSYHELTPFKGRGWEQNKKEKWYFIWESDFIDYDECLLLICFLFWIYYNNID